jgi:hypothetical protein
MNKLPSDDTTIIQHMDVICMFTDFEEGTTPYEKNAHLMKKLRESLQKVGVEHSEEYLEERLKFIMGQS